MVHASHQEEARYQFLPSAGPLAELHFVDQLLRSLIRAFQLVCIWSLSLVHPTLRVCRTPTASVIWEEPSGLSLWAYNFGLESPGPWLLIITLHIARYVVIICSRRPLCPLLSFLHSCPATKLSPPGVCGHVLFISTSLCLSQHLAHSRALRTDEQDHRGRENRRRTGLALTAKATSISLRQQEWARDHTGTPGVLISCAGSLWCCHTCSGTQLRPHHGPLKPSDCCGDCARWHTASPSGLVRDPQQSALKAETFLRLLWAAWREWWVIANCHWRIFCEVWFLSQKCPDCEVPSAAQKWKPFLRQAWSGLWPPHMSPADEITARPRRTGSTIYHDPSGTPWLGSACGPLILRQFWKHRQMLTQSSQIIIATVRGPDGLEK